MGGSSSKPVLQSPRIPPSPHAEITEKDRAILDLKLQRDKLKQYTKKIAIVRDREHEIAKEHVRNGNNDQARLALQRRKYQENLLESTNQQLMNMEDLVLNVEYKSVQSQVAAGLQKGNQVLADLHKELSLDAVERLLEESSEAIAYQEEISRLLSGQLSSDDRMSAEEELEVILTQVLPPTVSASSTASFEIVQLPSAPQHDPLVISDKEEDDDDEELEAMLA